MYKFENKEITITAWGTTFNLVMLKRNYCGSGRIAIELMTDKEVPFAKLTVNAEEVEDSVWGPGLLEEHEAIFKDYGENSSWFNAVANDTGFFRDTGKRCKLDYVEAPIYELLREEIAND